MRKSNLIINIIKKYPNLSPSDIKKLVNTIFDEFTSALVNNDRIEIRGFGSISIRKRKARSAKNPKTSELVSLNERNAIYFRMGKDLFDRLNQI